LLELRRLGVRRAATGARQILTSGPGRKFAPKWIETERIGYIRGDAEEKLGARERVNYQSAGIQYTDGSPGPAGDFPSIDWSSGGRRIVFYRDLEGRMACRFSDLQQGSAIPPGSDRGLPIVFTRRPVEATLYQAKWAQGHPVYTPEERKKFMYNKAPDLEVYHPFVWRGWSEFGSGVVGDIAPHSMNVIFMALDLGPPSAVEVVESSGMKKEMYPEWSVVRWEWPQRGIHPPFRIYWYDGGKFPPAHITGVTPPPQPGVPVTPLRGGVGGLIWIGTKGSLPQARGPYFDQKTEPYPVPPQKDGGREDVYKDWVAGVRTGKQPSCNFAYAGPFTEAFQLANVALRVGHRVEWDSLAFRVTNCREANQCLRRDYRRGWDLREIAGSAVFNV
jgi:hypothetical protein